MSTESSSTSESYTTSDSSDYSDDEFETPDDEGGLAEPGPTTRPGAAERQGMSRNALPQPQSASVQAEDDEVDARVVGTGDSLTIAAWDAGDAEGMGDSLPCGIQPEPRPGGSFRSLNSASTPRRRGELEERKHMAFIKALSSMSLRSGAAAPPGMRTPAAEGADDSPSEDGHRRSPRRRRRRRRKPRTKAQSAGGSARPASALPALQRHEKAGGAPHPPRRLPERNVPSHKPGTLPAYVAARKEQLGMPAPDDGGDVSDTPLPKGKVASRVDARWRRELIPFGSETGDALRKWLDRTQGEAKRRGRRERLQRQCTAHSQRMYDKLLRMSEEADDEEGAPHAADTAGSDVVWAHDRHGLPSPGPNAYHAEREGADRAATAQAFPWQGHSQGRGRTRPHSASAASTHLRGRGGGHAFNHRAPHASRQAPRQAARPSTAAAPQRRGHLPSSTPGAAPSRSNQESKAQGDSTLPRGVAEKLPSLAPTAPQLVSARRPPLNPDLDPAVCASAPSDPMQQPAKPPKPLPKSRRALQMKLDSMLQDKQGLPHPLQPKRPPCEEAGRSAVQASRRRPRRKGRKLKARR